ncbi:YciI family protein [Humibacter ginsenosidimutans]|nr:YciI family protein [Humibacter ginsenosidimutans]
MKYMLLLRASGCRALDPGTREERRMAMAAFSEHLVRAGVMLADGAVAAHDTEARVWFDGDDRSVVAAGDDDIDEDALRGFWILQVDSQREALEWARRIPATDGCAQLHRILDAGGEPAT